MKITTYGMIIACAGLATAARADIIESTFDTGDEGWIVADSANPAEESAVDTPFHFEDNGGFGGRITLPVDWEGTGFYVAPDAFVGDMSAMAGGTLSVDRIAIDPRYSFSLDQFDYEIDLTMTGNGQLLAVDLPTFSDLFATTQTVSFDSTGGWFFVDSGEMATDEEIAAVLADLGDLRIRGNTSPDGGAIAIDNVRMTPVPAPAGVLLIGLGTGLTVIGRRR